MKMKLLEPMPHSVRAKLTRLLSVEEEELIRVSTDLNKEREFGAQWVIVTNKRLLIVPTVGLDGVVEIPIEELIAAQTEALVGGGCLTIERKGKATITVPTPVLWQKSFLKSHGGLSSSVSENPS